MAISPAEVQSVLESAWNVRSKIAVCLIGPPGVGKTQGIYEFAEKKGSNVVEIIASQILPNEVSGITMPVAETHAMEIYDHARLSSLKDGDILFFDELFQAAPQTLSACLTLILERKMLSGKKLPDIMIVAAANPLPSANMIPLSIRQRFQFVEVKADYNEYKEYMLMNYGVEISRELWSNIDSDGTQYNVLTPRLCTQLIEWRKACKTDEDEHGWLTAVTDMFDTHITEMLDHAVVKQSGKWQILSVIKDMVNPLEYKVLTNLSLNEMYKRIQDLPNGNAILEVLGTIELKEV